MVPWRIRYEHIEKVFKPVRQQRQRRWHRWWDGLFLMNNWKMVWNSFNLHFHPGTNWYVNGSGTLPSGKDCLVSSMRRRRRPFASGSTLAGSVGLGTNLETVVKSRPAVASAGVRERTRSVQTAQWPWQLASAATTEVMWTKSARGGTFVELVAP